MVCESDGVRLRDGLQASGGGPRGGDAGGGGEGRRCRAGEEGLEVPCPSSSSCSPDRDTLADVCAAQADGRPKVELVIAKTLDEAVKLTFSEDEVQPPASE